MKRYGNLIFLCLVSVLVVGINVMARRWWLAVPFMLLYSFLISLEWEEIRIMKRADAILAQAPNNGCQHSFKFTFWHAGTSTYECEKCQARIQEHNKLWDGQNEN